MKKDKHYNRLLVRTMTSNRYKDFTKQTKTERIQFYSTKNVKDVFMQAEQMWYETETWINTR